MIRLVEHNEWVFFTILGCIAVLVMQLAVLYRDGDIITYIFQKYEDSNNQLILWILTTLVFITLMAILFSPYIPVVPYYLYTHNILGFAINKFWFVFIAFAAFYMAKIIISYIFFFVTSQIEKWQSFYYISTKYYFLFSLVLVVGNIINYYFPIDKLKALPIYFIVVMAFFILKQFLFMFNRNNILPSPWYYKILYICTLQIIPSLVLWKLFFY